MANESDDVPVLSAERVKLMKHASPFIEPESASADVRALCDSHEALRAALSASQQGREEGARLLTAEEVKVIRDFYEEAATDHHPTMMALSVCDSHEALRAQVATLTDERDAARLERDEADDSRESLRLELRASESGRISDARELLRRAEAAEARLLALTFQPGPSDPQAPDPPHTRPDYADCWQSGWRTGYAVARDSAEARLLVQEGEIARLRELKESAVEILKRFKESEANGASTRDRRYVIDILEFSLGREQANG